MHLLQMKAIIEDAALKKVTEAEESNKAASLQRQLTAFEEDVRQQQKSALKKQQVRFVAHTQLRLFCTLLTLTLAVLLAGCWLSVAAAAALVDGGG